MASSNPAADVNDCNSDSDSDDEEEEDEEGQDEEEEEEEGPAADAGTTTSTIVVSLLGQVSAGILLTDSLYVHKMGRAPGAYSFVLVSALSY